MSTQPNPIVNQSHTAESILEILELVNLAFTMAPHAVGLVKHFANRLNSLPPEQRQAYFEETSAGLRAIAEKARAEQGEGGRDQEPAQLRGRPDQTKAQPP